MASILADVMETTIIFMDLMFLTECLFPLKSTHTINVKNMHGHFAPPPQSRPIEIRLSKVY